MTRSRNRVLAAAVVAAILLSSPAQSADIQTVPAPPALTQALGHLESRDWLGAFRTGRHAFRTAETDTMRYHAARVVAIAAMQLDRPLTTKFWLRRASDVAPGPVEAAKVKRNYRVLQARSSWRYRLDFGLRHSDNVNGGASSPLNIIDDFPIAGVLSGRAQALPGTIATTQASVTRRLHRGARSQTALSLGLIDNRIKLDEAGKDTAPGVRSREFDQTELSLTLGHTRAWRRPGWATSASLGVAQNRYGRKRYFQALSLNLAQRMQLGEQVSLTVNAGARRKFFETGGQGETLSLGATLGYALSNGSRVSLNLSHARTDGIVSPLDYATTTARVSYTLGQPVMGVSARVAVGISETDYPDYSLGIFPVPGGRGDDSVFGSLALTWEAVQYAGFSPTITLKAAETDSNVSRFATEEVSVSIGIASSF